MSEKWYGTKYKVAKYSDDFLASLETCSDEFGFSLPEPNPYIPRDFSLLKLDSQEVDSSLFRFYWFDAGSSAAKGD